MPIDFYPSVAKVKRNGVYQNLPGFIPQTGDASIEAMIANTESSTTAQYVHPKDSYFILNDTLYQADENIAVNDSISVGTNCHVAVLGDDVGILNEKVNRLDYPYEAVSYNMTINSGGDYLYGSNTVGTAPKRRNSTGKWGIIDLRNYPNGILKIETPLIKSNSTVSCLWVDSNGMVMSKFVTYYTGASGGKFSYNSATGKYETTIRYNNVGYFYYSAYTGSSTSLSVTIYPADDNRIYHVSASGNDSNLGRTSTFPLATIAEAIKRNAKIIILDTDIYESVSIYSQYPLDIRGSGHVIYGDEVLTTEAYNSIVKAPYTADSRITKCYVDHTTPLTENVSGSDWKGPKFNIACFCDDKKLTPVADVATCEATVDSFTWYDGYFYLNSSGTRYSYVTKSTGMYLSGGEITLDKLSIKHFYSNLLEAINCNLTVNQGKYIGSVNMNCITVEGNTAIFNNVETAISWNDGINVHGEGESILNDCYCHNCSDDGVSQHDSSKGVVNGGEFSYCGKGGVSSPINAAKVDIYNIYAHHNDYGVYASSSSGTPLRFNIFGCVIQENRIGVNIAGHTARIHANKISGNTGQNTKTESDGSIVDLDA